MSRFSMAIQNLQISGENQSAARGRIMDADFAAETANLSRAQILQQAGSAMVAQANQLPQPGAGAAALTPAPGPRGPRTSRPPGRLFHCGHPLAGGRFVSGRIRIGGSMPVFSAHPRPHAAAENAAQQAALSKA